MFTQRCFIRKNTLELKAKLKELGYSPFYSSDRDNREGYRVLGCNDWPWAPPSFFNICSDKHGNLDYPNNWNDYFDCGYNEELFLAVAALRNDGDYMQWFTDGKNWVLCDREDWVDMYSVLCSGGKYKQEDMDKFHKATVR